MSAWVWAAMILTPEHWVMTVNLLSASCVMNLLGLAVVCRLLVIATTSVLVCVRFREPRTLWNWLTATTATV